MRETKKSYHRGLEFYTSPDMGLCGIENDEGGGQHTYQYLTTKEATEWVQTWVNGQIWHRQSNVERTDAC